MIISESIKDVVAKHKDKLKIAGAAGVAGGAAGVATKAGVHGAVQSDLKKVGSWYKDKHTGHGMELNPLKAGKKALNMVTDLPLGMAKKATSVLGKIPGSMDPVPQVGGAIGAAAGALGAGMAAKKYLNRKKK